MREIKFRAWDKISKKMFTPVSLLSSFDSKECSYAVETKSHIYMQFTGLLDKNGKEVYEGDIILNQTYKRKQKVEVFWKGCIKKDDSINGKEWIDWGGWSFRKIPTEKGMTLSIDNDKIEVIGNIFENKNLLETQKS